MVAGEELSAAAALGESVMPMNNPQNSELQAVAVVERRSSGNSSALESLVRRYFVPRGSFTWTRPLVLELVDMESIADGVDEEWAEFLHLPGKKLFEYDQIRIVIDALMQDETEIDASNEPISLKIFSPNVVESSLHSSIKDAFIAEEDLLDNHPVDNDLSERCGDPMFANTLNQALDELPLERGCLITDPSSLPNSNGVPGSAFNMETRISSSRCDLLSELPDCLLSCILSRLPTQEAVQTSVLNSRWKQTWKCVYTIEVCDAEFVKDHSRVPAKFIKFLDKFFEETALLLKDVYLNLSLSYESTRLESWIATALERKAETLEIYYPTAAGIDFYVPRDFTLACHLKRLLAILPCICRINGMSKFLKLESLYLHDVVIQNIGDAEKIQLRFPALKECTLVGVKWIDAKFIKIEAPELDYMMTVTDKLSGHKSHCINVTSNLPILFRTLGGFPEIMTVHPSPQAATFDNEYGMSETELLAFGMQFRKMLGAFSDAKTVELSGYIVTALCHSRQGIAGIPIYASLDWVDITSVCSIKDVFEFLHSTPNLEKLVLHESHLYSTCSRPSFIPPCLLSRLQLVVFTNFAGCPPEMDLAIFILENAGRLKRLYVSGETATSLHVQQLELASKSSTCVSIQMIPPRELLRTVYCNGRE